MTNIRRSVRTLLLAVLLAGTTGIAAQVRWVTAQDAGDQLAPAQTVGEGPNRAALVVRFGDGTVQTQCVAFAEPSITGQQLLDRSGLVPITDPDGAVCSLSGQGCPPDDCFCACPFPECEYWAYYHWQGGAWSYSNVGAFGQKITNGSLEGWSWGEGDFSQGVPPPVIAYSEICLAETPATSTPTATATTQSAAALQRPVVAFQAAVASLTAGQCTVLTWQVQNAVTVLLDGVAVNLQGSQQVCPAASRRWTLTAANSAGQSIEYVDIQVAASATATPVAGATATPTPPAVTQQTPLPGSPVVAATAPPIIAPATRSLPVPVQAVPAVLPPPAVAGAAPAVAPAPQFVGGVPLAPTAQPGVIVAASPYPTPTRFVFAPPPTGTPRPRRELGMDGRATPTPILAARGEAQGPSGRAADQGVTPGGASTAADRMAQARAFNPDLLPGYAAYALALAVLAGLGWFVMRRKNGHPLPPSGARGSAEPASRDGLTDRRKEQVGHLS